MAKASGVPHLPAPWGLYLTADRDIWIQDANERIVCEMVPAKHPAGALANAEHLCRAVNCHADLLAACEAALEFLSRSVSDFELRHQLRSAIADARGEPQE